MTNNFLQGDLSGLQAIRLYTPCDDGDCDVFEDPSRIRMTSNRWYPSAVRLDDGSALIFGGSTSGAYVMPLLTSNLCLILSP